MEKIKVCLSDWQMISPQAMSFVSAEDKFEVIDEAANNEEALAFIEENSPNVAILNASHARFNGIEVARCIKQRLPSVGVILMIDRDNEEQLLSAMKNGINACVSKDVDPGDLAKIVRVVAQGRYPIGDALFKSTVASRVLKEFEELSISGEVVGDLMTRLSLREAEVLCAIAANDSSDQVSTVLGIPERDVSGLPELIRCKLLANEQVRSVAEAMQGNLMSDASRRTPVIQSEGTPAEEHINTEESHVFKERLAETAIETAKETATTSIRAFEEAISNMNRMIGVMPVDESPLDTATTDPDIDQIQPEALQLVPESIESITEEPKDISGENISVDHQLPADQESTEEQPVMLVDESPLDTATTDPDIDQIQPEALQLVPESMARIYNVMPLAITDNGLQVAMTITNGSTLETLASWTQMKIVPVRADAEDIRKAIERNYKGKSEIKNQDNTPTSGLPTNKPEYSATVMMRSAEEVMRKAEKISIPTEQTAEVVIGQPQRITNRVEEASRSVKKAAEPLRRPFEGVIGRAVGIAKSTHERIMEHPVKFFGQLALATLLLVIGGFGVLHFCPDYNVYIVRSESMKPAINLGDMVVTGPLGEEISPGTVVTYKHREALITHRALSVIGDTLVTKGDAMEDPDPWPVTLSDVNGIYLFKIPYVGYLSNFIKTKSGWFLVIVMPATLLVAFISKDIVKEALSTA